MLFIFLDSGVIALLIVFALYVYICSYGTRAIPENLQLRVGLILGVTIFIAIGGLIFLLTRYAKTEGEVFGYATIAFYLIVLLAFILPPTLMIWSMWLRNRSVRNSENHRAIDSARIEATLYDPEIQPAHKPISDRKQPENI